MNIYEVLPVGRDNAIPCRDLMTYFNATEREITQHIEAERLKGVPICAAHSAPAGYYMPADKDELQAYCASLERHAKAIKRTAKACKTAMNKFNKSEVDNT